jgi:hypothetical protein
MPKPIEIPFPLGTAPGIRAQESAGRVINAYVEPLGPTAMAGRVWRRAPGLTNFGTSTHTGYRGAIEVNGTLYAAIGASMTKWTSAGGAGTDLTGTMTGTKRGFFARNNAVTPSIVFVDPDGSIALITAGSPGSISTTYPDLDLPAVNSVCGLDGYLVFTTGSGLAYATDLNSTAVNALSFGAADAKPDALTRAVAFGRLLILAGPSSTEFWQDVGAFPFPFQRGEVRPLGLIGPYAIAGDQDGFGKALFQVGHDNGVYEWQGYDPVKISPPDLDGLIEAVTDKTTIQCCCYIARGHAYLEVSSPTFSWVYDKNNGQWHERQRYGATVSRIAGNTVYAFGKWLTGDTQTGNIQQITNTAYDEVGSPLRVRIESGPVSAFPSGMPVGRADFRFVTGVGVASGTDPIQTNPSVEISWSDDGGITWSNPLIRKLGAQSASDQLVSLVGCTGRTRWEGRRWRLDISDPVHVGFMGGTQSIDPRVRG